MCRTLCAFGARNKEWRPRGLASPLWREWLLSSGEDVVCVTEGLIDAMALEWLVGAPTVALGGVGCATRLTAVLAAVLAPMRPRRVVVAMDEDEAGRAARERILRDLRGLGVPCSAMEPYPGGAKDADEWLMGSRGRAWDFDELAPAAGGRSAVVMAGWSDGRCSRLRDRS